MKKTTTFGITLLLLFIHTYSAQASAGIWRGSLNINLNGTQTTYHQGAGADASFSGANLGSINSSSTFQLQDPYLFSFKNGGCDVTGAHFYYRVFKQGNMGGAYNQIDFTFVCNCVPPGGSCWRTSVSSCGNSTDQEWGNAASNIDLLAAALAADGSMGNYSLEVYWTIDVNLCGTSPIQLGPLTANFTATTSLPIELTAFQAQKIDHSVALRWTTATEQNNDRFEIQRSANGLDWSVLATIPTQNGNARTPQTYTFSDQHPWPTRDYYRLRQVDVDGKSSFSPVKMVDMDHAPTARIFPNPVEDGLLQLTLPGNDNSNHIRLHDAQGRLLRTWTIDSETETTLPLDLAGLPTGILFLQVNGTTPLRVVKK